MLCGYIFAILVDEPWAYMLPIEPVLDEIGILFPQDIDRPDVPAAATFEKLLALSHSDNSALSSKVQDASSQVRAEESVDKSVKTNAANLALPSR